MRAVHMAKQRILEARKLGFTTCILPKVSLDAQNNVDGITLLGVENVQQAVRKIL